MAPDRGREITRRARDGRLWRIGGDAEVAWIRDGTQPGVAITSGIPAVFDAYATVVLPFGDEYEEPGNQDRHDQAVIAVLSANTGQQPWWLGYLDTGSDDIVFPDVPMVELYSQWRYVLVEAGPNQAAKWRETPTIKRMLPEVMFPADRSWLLSTLWDDDWTCIGGPATLVADFLRHPDLKRRARQVALSDADVTPPGHVAR
jgi:hypothetical protein